MGDRRIEGNHEVEFGDGAGGLREVGELGRKIGDARRSFTRRRAELEAEEAHALRTPWLQHEMRDIESHTPIR
jgi:hypothetical protein